MELVGWLVGGSVAFQLLAVTRQSW
jgi:hypothetical protein